MLFKSFTGILLIGLLGIIVMTGSNKKQEDHKLEMHKIPVEFYDFEEPIYIVPSRPSRWNLAHTEYQFYVVCLFLKILHTFFDSCVLFEEKT